MLRVQSSPAFFAAVPSSIALTKIQEEELQKLRSEISVPKGLVLNLNRLPREVRSLAEQMDAASRGNQIIPFFTAAAKLQAWLPDVFVNHYIMVFNFLERSIQNQGDVAVCLENLDLIRSRIQPPCHANQILEIIAGKNLILTRDIRGTKEILHGCSEEELFLFWNDQTVFLYQSCNADEMQQELMGISVELDLSIHLKQGNISEVATILNEAAQVGIISDLSACASLIANLVEEPQILKHILGLISFENRERVILKLIDRFSPRTKNYTRLMFVLAEASEKPISKAQCYHKLCSFYLEAKRLSLAVAALDQIQNLLPSTLQLALGCISLASEQRDEEAALEILKTAKDEQTVCAMMKFCLLQGLPSVVARTVEIIKDPNLIREINIGLGLYYLRQAGMEPYVEELP